MYKLVFSCVNGQTPWMGESAYSVLGRQRYFRCFNMLFRYICNRVFTWHTLVPICLVSITDGVYRVMPCCRHLGKWNGRHNTVYFCNDGRSACNQSIRLHATKWHWSRTKLVGMAYLPFIGGFPRGMAIPWHSSNNQMNLVPFWSPRTPIQNLNWEV